MDTGFKLNPDEQIIRRVKRHWIELVSVFFISSGLVAAAIGLVASAGFYSRVAPMLPRWALNLIAVILVILALVIFYIGLWVFRRNEILITNLHVIEVKQTGLFGKEVSQLNMARIQDVTGRRKGFWSTVLNYGDVIIQTAGGADEFHFYYVPNPHEVADLCLSIHEEYARTHGGEVLL